jgi:dCMP deaminase
MHDVEPNPKKRMPPLVVLGLTGPVGSGCTTLSKILDNPDDTHHKGKALVEALRSLGWVTVDENEEISIDWKRLNQRVDELYSQISLKDNTGETDNERNGEIARKVRNQLKDVLEIREAVKALGRLKPYHRKGVHLFRTLSVSDLIVFRTLMAIEKEDFNIDGISDPKKKEKYEKFVRIARKYMMKAKKAQKALRRIGVEKYGDFYKLCYERKPKKELELLRDSFSKIHSVARTVKRRYWEENYLDYAEVMQDFGDNIRRFDDPFGQKKEQLPDYAYRLAKGISQMIYLLWGTKQSSFFVVDCLRNPYEIMYLRREFANFLLLSLFASKEIRRERIVAGTKKSLQKILRRELREDEERRIVESFEQADRRDSGRGIKGNEELYKQNVTKCVQISDIAINNDKQWTKMDLTASEESEELLRKSLRILCLILNPGCTKPNDDEMFMNLAYTMAVKSNCISRQVGAVVVGRDGYVVGAGWNDVGEGRISCGLRTIRDLGNVEFEPIVTAIRKDNETCEELMHRLKEKSGSTNQGDFREQLCFCLKDVLAERVAIPEYKDRIKKILGVEDEKANLMSEEIIKLEPLHQLEYCLALHAEENAVLQSAKIGGTGLQGGSMYVTCQPCSLCAKKIQQLGLRRVIYTEAYPESRPDIYMANIELKQFEGVKPRAYIKLFMPHHDQKEWQELEKDDLIPEI